MCLITTNKDVKMTLCIFSRVFRVQGHCIAEGFHIYWIHFVKKAKKKFNLLINELASNESHLFFAFFFHAMLS